MIDAKALIALFEQALSEEWGYIWGGRGQEWTKEKQAAAKRDMTVKYGAQWIGRRVADCSGLFAWAFDELGGSIYHGSNTIWNKWCTIKGTLVNGGRSDGLPLKPGTAVFLRRKSGDTLNRHHIGLYVGGDTVIEAKGTAYGVVTSKLSHWHEWGELENVIYGEEGNMVDTYLQRGAKGTMVRQLQEWLMNEGYSLPKYGVDGDYGAETEAAVKALQRDKGFEVTGIATGKAWQYLYSRNTEITLSDEPAPPSAPTGEEEYARIPKSLYDDLNAFFKGV